MATQNRSIRPIIILGFSIIFVTFGVFGGWAAVAKLDAAVVAPGTISLEGNRKVVQHLEGGIVEEIYVREADVIALAEAAGFQLADRSEINANPKDTRDHPQGVWTLPPGFALGDTDREKYAAIGESDRMTLKFVKPTDG